MKKITLEEAKAQLKATLSGQVKENEAGSVTVDLTDEDLQRFWESYIEIKQNQKVSPIEQARRQLTKTLSGKTEKDLAEKEELKATCQRLQKQNSRGRGGSALQRARKQLKDTLSKRQVDEERL